MGLLECVGSPADKCLLLVDVPSKMSYNFKNEEDVKLYLENLGIEYRPATHVVCTGVEAGILTLILDEKDAKVGFLLLVCHLLGDYLDAIKKDYHKAARIYKSNCDDENYPRSCHSYGSYLLTGQGVDKKNEEIAYSYFLKACSLGVGSSCFNAGMMTINPMPSQKREKDYTKGISLLDKSCSLDNPHACYFLSGLFIKGSDDRPEDPTVPRDMEKAFYYSEKACNLDHLYACMNLSVMYKKGDGVKQNEEMAKKISDKVEDIKQQIKSGITIEFQRGTDTF